MNKLVAAVFLAALTLGVGASCKKKDKGAAPGSVASESAADGAGSAAKSADGASAAGGADQGSGSAAVDPAEAAAEQEAAAADKARKQAALDYATMEDRYLNDPKGQWASSAKASSSFGSAGKEPPESKSSNTPWQATGAPNSDSWSNDHQDMGIDWLELKYDRPVQATEVRVVITNGVGAVSKLELIDEAGTAHELWSGTDDTTRDRRGPRTWLVRTFEKTPYKAVGVKVSFANAVVNGYKEVDAVQLVGE
jgi:hypothetical protein